MTLIDILTLTLTSIPTLAVTLTLTLIWSLTAIHALRSSRRTPARTADTRSDRYQPVRSPRAHQRGLAGALRILSECLTVYSHLG